MEYAILFDRRKGKNDFLSPDDPLQQEILYRKVFIRLIIVYTSILVARWLFLPFYVLGVTLYNCDEKEHYKKDS